MDKISTNHTQDASYFALKAHVFVLDKWPTGIYKKCTIPIFTDVYELVYNNQVSFDTENNY